MRKYIKCSDRKFQSVVNLEDRRIHETFDAILEGNRGQSGPVISYQLSKEERIKYGMAAE